MRHTNNSLTETCSEIVWIFNVLCHPFYPKHLTRDTKKINTLTNRKRRIITATGFDTNSD